MESEQLLLVQRANVNAEIRAEKKKTRENQTRLWGSSDLQCQFLAQKLSILSLI